MDQIVADFLAALRGLKDPETDDHLQYQLYQITEPLQERLKELDFSGAVGPIFAFFERYPSADFGTPGPLVHLLEAFPGKYEEELKASILRKPTSHPVWMMNRILNASKGAERDEWLRLMESVLEHPEATESAVDDAERFLEYQKRAG